MRPQRALLWVGRLSALCWEKPKAQPAGDGRSRRSASRRSVAWAKSRKSRPVVRVGGEAVGQRMAGGFFLFSGPPEIWPAPANPRRTSDEQLRGERFLRITQLLKQRGGWYQRPARTGPTSPAFSLAAVSRRKGRA